MIVGSRGRILAFALLLLPFIGGITPVFAFSQEVKDAQVLLNSLGFDAGVEDGIIGNKTNAALLEFYSSQQKSFDGVLSENELADLMDFVDAKARREITANQVTEDMTPYLILLLLLLSVAIIIFVVARRSEQPSAGISPSSPWTEPKPIRSIEDRISEYKPVKVKTQSQIQPAKKEISPIVGKCHVIDGDTIVIGKQHIRFAGMNAPELDEPYGKQAKWALVELCKGEIITAYPNGETSYNRIVAKCFLPDGRDLAAEMVKMELALDIPHFPNADYKHLETPNSRRKLRWRPKKSDPTK